MPPVDLLYVVAMISTSAASMCGNAALLLVVALNNSLQTETWAFTFSLCLSDLALGLGTALFGAYNGLAHIEGYAGDSALCHAAAFTFTLFQLASLHSLAWATVDRCAEICLALQYPRLFNRRRTRSVLALLWLCCAATAALPLFGFGSYSYSTSRFLCTPTFRPSANAFALMFVGLGVAVPILVMCSLNAYLVYVARTQALRGTFVCNEQHCYYVPAKNYFRSSIIMMATVACLLLCWLPYIVTCFYEVFTGRDCPAGVNAMAMWLVLLTSALNPWISSMTQKKYREALRGSANKLRQRFLKPQKETLPNHIRSPPKSKDSATPQGQPTVPSATPDTNPSSSRTPSPVLQQHMPAHPRAPPGGDQEFYTQAH